MNLINKKLLILVVTIVVIANLQTQNAKAAWGDLDPNFGSAGTQVDSVTDHYPSKVAFQADGKILVTGYRQLPNGIERIFLRRYLPSGQPDTSFGSNGSAIVYSLLSKLDDDLADDVVVLPNGQIAVAGRNRENFPTVWQFNANGRLDAEFGNGGRKVLSDPNYFTPVRLAVQNRSLIVGVNKSGFSPVNRAVLLRLNANGVQDSRFGTFGEAVSGIHGLWFTLQVEAESGKITVGGHSAENALTLGLDRLTAGGQNDADFVFANTGAPGFYGFLRFIRLIDQKYVFKFSEPAEFFNNYTRKDKLARLNTDGSPESVIAFSEGTESGTGCPPILVQQQDGKVIASSPARMRRFDAEINTATQEIRSCSSFSQFSYVTDAAIQTDNKIVVAGRRSGDGNLMLVRILAD